MPHPFRLLCALVLTVGDGHSALGAFMTATETSGQATDNTLSAAQVIPGTAFTRPVPATVFDPPGWSTATIIGTGGGSDVDFYTFTFNGGDALFDIDTDPFQFDSLISLFNTDGTLIGLGVDSAPVDAGSDHGLDAFLGVVTLAPGTYHVAVSTWPIFPAAFFAGVTLDPVDRPDGVFGGYNVSGAAAGNSAYGGSGADSGLPYTLHISLEDQPAVAVPEPSSLVLMICGILCVVTRSSRRCGG